MKWWRRGKEEAGWLTGQSKGPAEGASERRDKREREVEEGALAHSPPYRHAGRWSSGGARGGGARSKDDDGDDRCRHTCGEERGGGGGCEVHGNLVDSERLRSEGRRREQEHYVVLVLWTFWQEVNE